MNILNRLKNLTSNELSRILKIRIKFYFSRFKKKTNFYHAIFIYKHDTNFVEIISKKRQKILSRPASGLNKTRTGPNSSRNFSLANISRLLTLC